MEVENELEPPEWIEQVSEGRYIDVRFIEGQGWCCLYRLAFHWTMLVDLEPAGYRNHYCYRTYKLGKEAIEKWDGTGDPINWHRNPETGRRRNIETGEEWTDW